MQTTRLARLRLVRVLACGPLTVGAVTDRLRVTRVEAERLLNHAWFERSWDGGVTRWGLSRAGHLLLAAGCDPTPSFLGFSMDDFPALLAATGLTADRAEIPPSRGRKDVQVFWTVAGPRGGMGTYVPETRSVRCGPLFGRAADAGHAAAVFVAAAFGAPAPPLEPWEPPAPERTEREERQAEYKRRHKVRKRAGLVKARSGAA